MTLYPPIVVVEDNAGIALTVRSVLAKAQDLFGLEGKGNVHTINSAPLLMVWLESQPDHTIKLLLLDYFVYGGTVAGLMPQLRSPETGKQHRAFHPEALVIGWSSDPATSAIFRAGGADGFISKQLPMAGLGQRIASVLSQRRAGAPWIEIVSEG